MDLDEKPAGEAALLEIKDSGTHFAPTTASCMR